MIYFFGACCFLLKWRFFASSLASSLFCVWRVLASFLNFAMKKSATTPKIAKPIA